MEEVQLTAPEGIRFVPARHSGVGVLTVAGSSGRIDAERARILGAHGALAESIRWFGGPGQNAGPWEVPLELFLDRVEALAADCDRVLVMGTSFGAEAALLTAVHSPHVDAVVAFAPSDVVWAGVTPVGRMTSHWTLGGEPLPFVPLMPDWESTQDPPAFVDLYERSIAAAPEAAEAAAIAVETIPEVVLVVGGDDRVWPSAAHASRIRDRRQRHGRSTLVVADDSAGHRALLPGEPEATGGVRMARGGTVAADRRLGAAAWQRIEALIAGLTPAGDRPS